MDVWSVLDSSFETRIGSEGTDSGTCSKSLPLNYESEHFSTESTDKHSESRQDTVVLCAAGVLRGPIWKLFRRIKKGTGVIPVPRGRTKRSGGETALVSNLGGRTSLTSMGEGKGEGRGEGG